MNLLPVGDGSRYIDLSTAQCFDVLGITYCKSQYGVWVRREREGRSGQVITERDAFKAFIDAKMQTEAESNFPDLFKEGFNVDAATEPGLKSADTTPRHLWRFVFGGFIVLVVAVYIIATIIGKIPASRQISLGGLAVIVIGVIFIITLFHPQWIRDVQRFQLGSFSLDMRQRLQEIQESLTPRLEEKPVRQADDTGPGTGHHGTRAWTISWRRGCMARPWRRWRTTAGTVWAWGPAPMANSATEPRPRTSPPAVKVGFPAGVKITSLPNPMPFDAGLAIDSQGNVGTGAQSGPQDAVCAC
jgi:hypothetical protein